MLKVLSILASLCLSVEAQALLGAGPSTTDKVIPQIGISFPLSGTLPDLQLSRTKIIDLGAKTTRISENWKTREAVLNTYSWAGLDNKIDTLRSLGTRIFLTVESDGPTWRCGTSNARSCAFSDTAAFRTYMTALCQRYSGRVHMMQFGNESYSEYWYAGTSAQFIASANIFYDVVKAEMPGVPVVLSGFQTSLPHNFAVCSHGRSIPSYNSSGAVLSAAGVTAMCADPVMVEMRSRFVAITSGARHNYIDIHMYDNIEYWAQYMQSMRTLLPGRTFLSTELGCPNKRYESADDIFHGQRVSLILATLPSLQLLEAYYFKLAEYASSDDAEHEKSGLLGHPELDEKPAYNIIKSFNQALP